MLIETNESRRIPAVAIGFVVCLLGLVGVGIWAHRSHETPWREIAGTMVADVEQTTTEISYLGSDCAISGDTADCHFPRDCWRAGSTCYIRRGAAVDCRLDARGVR